MANDGPIKLPKTIEGAQSRYLYVYDNYCTAGPHDKERLRNLAIAKIQFLRLKAPEFFETKLPDIVNQAASALLTCGTDTPEGENDFNHTHRDFLWVLDGLCSSQPKGEVSFQTERDRIKLMDKYKKEHLVLRERLDRLEATELSTDELGEEVSDSNYTRILAEIERVRLRLSHIAQLIAKLEGENIKEELKIQLQIQPRSILNRLTNEQIIAFESKLDTYFAQKKKFVDCFPDKQVIEEMLKSVKVDFSKFERAEVAELLKEALDAIRAFFRMKDNKRRSEYHDNLIGNKRLRPKEGLILANPDDIPEEVKQKLDASEKETQKKLEECLESYSELPCDEMKGCDDLEDDPDNESDEQNKDIILEMETNKPLFLRVKEEPRDDYVADPEGSGDECVISDRVQLDLNVNASQQGEEDEGSPSRRSEIEEYEVDEDEQGDEEVDSGVERGDSEEGKTGTMEEDDDDIEVLGIIEPTDKCLMIDYEKDDVQPNQ